MIEYLTWAIVPTGRMSPGRLLMAPISITAKNISGRKPSGPLRGVEQRGFTSPYAMTAIRRRQGRDFACLMVPSQSQLIHRWIKEDPVLERKSHSSKNSFRSSVGNGKEFGRKFIRNKERDFFPSLGWKIFAIMKSHERISITNLTKTYANGTQALRDQPGSSAGRFLCASGANGAGKTTIIAL